MQKAGESSGDSSELPQGHPQGLREGFLVLICVEFVRDSPGFLGHGHH